MLYSWFSRLERVQTAQTLEEREGIFRFRYDLYVTEGGLALPTADHERCWVRDVIDDAPSTVHLYAGNLSNIRGTARLQVFEPGKLPQQLRDQYATDLFPHADGLSVAELTGFLIRPGLRGRLLLPAMVRAIYECLVGTHGVDIMLASCRPGLVTDYRQFGLRPYSAPLINEFDGISVPLLSVLCDAAYFDRSNAMAADLVAQHYGPGARPVLDLEEWASLCHSDEAGLDASDTAALNAAASRLSATDASVKTIFDALSPTVRRQLIDGGCLVEVPRESDVTVQGNVDRDLYVVLQGVFTVHRDGVHLASLGRGEFFGELSFFNPHQGRSATVRAATDGQVLLIRPDFLRSLMHQDPDAAYAVFMAVGHTLSRRMNSLQT